MVVNLCATKQCSCSCQSYFWDKVDALKAEMQKWWCEEVSAPQRKAMLGEEFMKHCTNNESGKIIQG